MQSRKIPVTTGVSLPGNALHFCNPALQLELNDGSFFSLPVK